jgi:lipopolysaccharide/colanic/teichoic acid biosynthesis glycosyltransferase
MNASMARERPRFPTCTNGLRRSAKSVERQPDTDSLRRPLDICFALALLLVAMPILAFAAMAICIDSRGPALYRQTRVGRAGKTFEIYKLRTMYINAELDGEPRFAARRDPRVTRVGRLLRRSRVDELPQQLNVILGDMSFIGPRPERPQFVQQFRQEIPDYAQRLNVKPGLTGLAQVRYHYTNDVHGAECKLGYDLQYIRERSPLLDLRILFETAFVVVTGRGAI